MTKLKQDNGASHDFYRCIPCMKDSSTLGAYRRLGQDTTITMQQGCSLLGRTRHSSKAV